MRHLVRLIIILFFIKFVLVSCQQDEYYEPQETFKSNYRYDKDINSFAEMVAKAMNSRQFRASIKKEAVKEFDGDFDVLMAKYQDKQINTEKSSEGINLFDHLAEKSTKTKSLNDKKKAKKYLKELQNKYPLLQISVPEVYENSTKEWDVDSHIPLVAYIPSDYQEGETKQIPAYDQYGKKVFIDAVTEPTEPVIVVSMNERLIVFEKTKSLPEQDFIEIASTSDYIIGLAPGPGGSHIVTVGGGTGGGGTGGGGTGGGTGGGGTGGCATTTPALSLTA